MDFMYTADTGKYRSLLSEMVCGMPCKHVLSITSRKAARVWEESQKIGAMANMWGYTTGIWEKPDKNRTVQIHTIKKMVCNCMSMPFRVVIDTKGIPWVDNLHSAIRDIMVYGDDIRLGDVSCYIIDLTGNCPVVADISHSLHNNIDDVKGAISAAYKRNGRVNDAIREEGYTIGEFLSENDINAETAEINTDMVIKYKSNKADRMYFEAISGKKEKDTLRERLIGKIREVKCCSNLQAVNYADTILHAFPMELMRNVEEWVENKEISDIPYAGTSIPAIMSPYVSDMREGFIDSAMCMAMYLLNYKKA